MLLAGTAVLAVLLYLDAFGADPWPFDQWGRRSLFSLAAVVGAIGACARLGLRPDRGASRLLAATAGAAATAAVLGEVGVPVVLLALVVAGAAALPAEVRAGPSAP